MKTGLFAVFDSQKSKDRTAGPVFSSLGPVWLQSFCSLETGLPNTRQAGLMPDPDNLGDVRIGDDRQWYLN